MALLCEAGLRPYHHLLDVGAGSLRLGCKALSYLDPGHYWATDASRALMLRGREAELDDPARLSPEHLIEDADFAYPGVPARIDFALAFAVFTHLPADRLAAALTRARAVFPDLRAYLFTVFLAPVSAVSQAWRQADGVVTHPDRPPYHQTQEAVFALVRDAGFAAELTDTLLPRGQRLFLARPVR